MSGQAVPDTEFLGSREVFPLRRILAQLLAFMRTLDGASIILVWVCIAVARALPHFVGNAEVSDPLVAVVALPLFVIVPRQLGILLQPLARAWQVQLGAVEAYVVAWLAGIWLMVIGLTILTGLVGVPAPFAAAVVFMAATGSSCIFGLRTAASGNQRKGWNKGALLREGGLVMAALALVSVPLTMVRASQPYPLLAGWGMFNMNYRILEFVEADHIPIAPGIHTPVHASLLGVSSITTGIESFGLIWAGPLLLYSIYGLGLFVFARRILGGNLLGLVTLWVAIWVLSFQALQHLHAVGMRAILLAMYPWILLLLHGQLSALRAKRPELAFHLFVPLVAVGGVALVRWFLPSALQVWALLLLATWLLALVRSLPEGVQRSVGLLTLVGYSLTFLHFIEGPIFFGLGLGFVLLLRWKPISVGSRFFLAGLYALVIGFIALQAADVLTFDDESMITRLLLGGGRADATDIAFERKLHLLREGLTYPILSLLALSAARNLLWPNSTHIAAITVFSFATFVFFLPESGMHRVMGAVIPLVGLSVALEVHWFAQHLPILRWKNRQVLWRGALVVVAVIALTPALTSSLRSQLRLPSQFGFPLPQAKREFTNITVGEYRASEWIAENTPQEWTIVSDPMTMFFMEGLTFHPQVALKRVWVAESEYSVEDRERLHSLDLLVFGAPTVAAAVEEIESLTQEHPGILMVISHRTLDWLLAPEDLFRRSKPREQVSLDVRGLKSFCDYYEMEPCPARFFESGLLSVIYNRDGVAVLVPRQRMDELEVTSRPSDG